MKQFTLKILAFLAQQIIRRHKPFVIGVTGTVGKTTTTNFLYEFLRKIHGDTVYKSIYDYNGEFGVPLAILQSKSPKRNPFLWIFLLLKWVYLFVKPGYPRYLILEYGIDRKGEMAYLTEIVSPDIGIVLNISPNHVTQFPDYQDYVNEKLLLGRRSQKVVYNWDDTVLKNEFSNRGDSISYGFLHEGATVYASDIRSELDGLRFTLHCGDASDALTFDLIGNHQVYNILSVMALGRLMGIDLPKFKELISGIEAQKGRGVLLKGVNGSIIIDGTYNGGFVSIMSGIDYMDSIRDGTLKTVLFLGDMRELGPESKRLHGELADRIIATSHDFFVLVGEEMRNYVYERLASAFSENRVFWFRSSRDAGEKLLEIIRSSEKHRFVIYAKGSQNTIFLEEGIKKILFDYRDAGKLCRQSEHWLSLKETYFSQII